MHCEQLPFLVKYNVSSRTICLFASNGCLQNADPNRHDNTQKGSFSPQTSDKSLSETKTNSVEMLLLLALLLNLCTCLAGINGKTKRPCETCSLACVACRLRGFSRLDTCGIAADCYTERVLSKVPQGTCTLKLNSNLSDGTLVCRNKRCRLDDTDYCQTKGADEQCPYVSPASRFINNTTCYAYVPKPELCHLCDLEEEPFCRYLCLEDIVLPGGHVFPTNVYSLVKDDCELLQETAGVPFVVSKPNCPLEYADPQSGLRLVLAKQLCLLDKQRVIKDGYALLMQQWACPQGSTKLIVNNVVGCYVETCAPSNRCTSGIPVCYYALPKH